MNAIGLRENMPRGHAAKGCRRRRRTRWCAALAARCSTATTRLRAIVIAFTSMLRSDARA